MKINLQELLLLAMVVFLLGVFIFVRPGQDEVTAESQRRNDSIDSATEHLDKNQTLRVRMRKSNKSDNRNRKDSADLRIKIGSNRVPPKASLDFESGHLNTGESDEEISDLSAELGIHKGEIDDALMAMFENNEHDEVQEDILAVESEWTRSQIELEEDVFDNLLESDLSMEETEMVLETLLSNSENDPSEETSPIEGEESVVTEATSEDDIVDPIGDMDLPEEIIEDLIEAMSMEDEGNTLDEEYAQEEDEFGSLPDEEQEKILQEFHNLGMSIDEIDEILETLSTDSDDNEVIME